MVPYFNTSTWISIDVIWNVFSPLQFDFTSPIAPCWSMGWWWSASRSPLEQPLAGNPILNAGGLELPRLMDPNHLSSSNGMVIYYRGIRNFYISLFVSSYRLILLFPILINYLSVCCQRILLKESTYQGALVYPFLGGDGLPRACTRMGEWPNLEGPHEGRQGTPDVPEWWIVLPSQPCERCHQCVGSSPSVEKVAEGIEEPVATPWTLNPGGDQSLPKMRTLHRRQSPLQVQRRT